MEKTFRGDWMWAEACEMLVQAERLRRQFFQLGSAAAKGPVWEPPADVCDTGDTLWMEIALPGVLPGNVEVAVEPDGIRIQADRPLPVGARRGRIRRLEIPYGRFERHIEFPSGRYELEHSEFANGCVQLVLRKL